MVRVLLVSKKERLTRANGGITSKKGEDGMNGVLRSITRVIGCRAVSMDTGS